MAEFVAIFWPYKSGQSCCRCCCCCCCCFCRCYSTLNCCFCCCCSCCHSAGWLNLAPSDTEATPTSQPKPAPAIVASLLAWGCAVDTHRRTYTYTHTHNKYPHLYVKQENGQSRWSHRNLLPWKAAKSQSGDGLAPTATHTHIRTHTTIALKSAAKHTHTIV